MKLSDLLTDGYTVVIYKNDKIIYKSRESGIKPLVDLIDSKQALTMCIAADKIVGKAAAMLYALADIKAVYAQVMSRSGLEVLNRFGVEAHYNELADFIVNRKGDGACPMENAVRNVTEPSKALEILRNKVYGDKK